MMNKLTRISCLALALLITVLLTGCHGTGSLQTFDAPDTFDDSRQHDLSFWAKNDTNRVQTAIYEEAMSSFHELYPNITVSMRLYNDYGQIYNDVITNIATGTTPNVCITYPDHIATYLTGSNCVVPLDSLMADEKYGLGGSELKFDSPSAEEIIPQFLNEGVLSGQQYALPYMRSTEACYINKDFVEQLGYTLPEKLTWDFVWEVSEAAMAKDEEGLFLLNGQKVLIPFIYKSVDNMMIQMLRQLDAGYSTEEGDILLFNDATRELLQTLSEHAATRAFNIFTVVGYPANFLNAGQCIFAVDSTAGATWMGAHAPLIDIPEDSLVEFETVVMPIPQFDPENPKMISQGPSVCAFNKDDPQEVLASWLFMQYLLTDEIQIAYSGTEGYIPVTSKAQSSPEYQDYLSRAGEDNDTYYDVKIATSKLLLENIDNTFVTPVFNGSASLRNAAGQLIIDTVKNTLRKKEIDDEFFDTLFSDVASLYRLDQTEELGPLPVTSVALLASLGGTWVLILLYLVCDAVRKKKTAKQTR